MAMKDVNDYESFFSLPALLQKFNSLFILLSIFLCKFFSMPQKNVFIFVSTVKERFRLLLVLLHKKKKKTKKEWLRGFRLPCSSFLSVEGDIVKDKWRIYTNTKSFPTPSAERVMTCANKM